MSFAKWHPFCPGFNVLIAMESCMIHTAVESMCDVAETDQSVLKDSPNSKRYTFLASKGHLFCHSRIVGLSGLNMYIYIYIYIKFNECSHFAKSVLIFPNLRHTWCLTGKNKITKYYEVWDEIINPFPNFNDATVDVWQWISNFISDFTGHVIIYPCWDWGIMTGLRGCCSSSTRGCWTNNTRADRSLFPL